MREDGQDAAPSEKVTSKQRIVTPGPATVTRIVVGESLAYRSLKAYIALPYPRFPTRSSALFVVLVGFLLL